MPRRVQSLEHLRYCAGPNSQTAHILPQDVKGRFFFFHSIFVCSSFTFSSFLLTLMLLDYSKYIHTTYMFFHNRLPKGKNKMSEGLFYANPGTSLWCLTLFSIFDTHSSTMILTEIWFNDFCTCVLVSLCVCFCMFLHILLVYILYTSSKKKSSFQDSSDLPRPLPPPSYPNSLKGEMFLNTFHL